MKLLTLGNTKTIKGQARGYMTFIMHFAPAKQSGYNVCPMASLGCSTACLYTAGRGRFEKIKIARIAKTKRFFENHDVFMDTIVSDIGAAVRKATREGYEAVIRLNGTSDIRWEVYPVTFCGVTYPNIMAVFPNVQFYDYTKIENRKNIPHNYNLTFSRSETNGEKVTVMLQKGFNVAVVFNTPKKAALPEQYLGVPVVDGDSDDLRFLDPKNVIVGLRAKGDAKKDTKGFVVSV